MSSPSRSQVENPVIVPEASGAESRAGREASGGTKAYDAIASGAGIATLDDRLIVRIVGDDRVPFMHGMCSNDINGLATGEVAPALILTEHAHIIADFFVYAEADALIIEIDRALWPKARAHLERFLVADDVEFEELENLGVIDIEGPAAAKVAATVAGGAAAALPPWRHREFEGVRCANLPRFGGPAFTLLVERARIVSMIETLSERGSSAGVREIAVMDAKTLEMVRVEHGVARVGVDTGGKNDRARGAARCRDLVQQGLLPRAGNDRARNCPWRPQEEAVRPADRGKSIADGRQRDHARGQGSRPPD